MAYQRKTRDVWQLIWNGEIIDSFEHYDEAKAMRKEYEMAYHSEVRIKLGRERIGD